MNIKEVSTLKFDGRRKSNFLVYNAHVASHFAVPWTPSSGEAARLLPPTPLHCSIFNKCGV
jgi:hypothetical protein